MVLYGGNGDVSNFSLNQTFIVSGYTHIFNFNDIKGLKLCASEVYVPGSRLYYYLVKGSTFTSGTLTFTAKNVNQYSAVFTGDYDYLIIPSSHLDRIAYGGDRIEYGQIRAFFCEP